jgi:hypothetical protein
MHQEEVNQIKFTVGEMKKLMKMIIRQTAGMVASLTPILS